MCKSLCQLTNQQGTNQIFIQLTRAKNIYFLNHAHLLICFPPLAACLSVCLSVCPSSCLPTFISISMKLSPIYFPRCWPCQCWTTWCPQTARGRGSTSCLAAATFSTWWTAWPRRMTDSSWTCWGEKDQTSGLCTSSSLKWWVHSLCGCFLTGLPDRIW